MNAQTDSMRLDKWLWAARFFKTRKLATEAISGGKVHRGGRRVKPSQLVQIGDELEITRGAYRYTVTIDGLNKQRGPASVAQTLYTESADSLRAREQLSAEMRVLAAQTPSPQHRPDKRSRRKIIRFTRKQD